MTAPQAYDEVRLVKAALGRYYQEDQPLYVAVHAMWHDLQQAQEQAARSSEMVSQLQTLIQFLENKIENMEYER